MGGMRYRKLRIAWSMFWGLAAVLLIVLWVRSCSNWDTLVVRWSATKELNIESVVGEVRWYVTDRSSDRVSQICAFIHESLRASDGEAIRELGFVRSLVPFKHLPILLPFLCSMTATAAPWLPYRISLRTLLIATTLVAVVLGLIVWLS
jgi:hypothetical protein